jgi:hypothetical protein
VDTSRLLIQWVVVGIITAAVYWLGLSPKVPVPKLARTCSEFPWIQAAEGVYQLDAPGMTIFVEVNHVGEYQAYRRPDGESSESLLIFDKPEDAFAYADALVPDEAVALLKEKARGRE